MEAIDKLKARVKSGLSNPEFIEAEYDPLYETALQETEGIVGNKDLADAFVMDIAYYRFLLLVDVVVRESDETNYKLALSSLKSAGYITLDESTGEVTTTSGVIVKQRDSAYN